MGQVGKQVRYDEYRVPVLKADVDVDGAALPVHHDTVEGQGDVRPVVGLEPAVVVGSEHGGSGIAIAVASKTDSPGGYHMLIFMLNLPLLFLSNALYPLETMPRWMEIAARINPTTYVVSGMRSMTFATGDALAAADTIPLGLCFIVVGIFLAFGMILGYRAFMSSIK